MSDEDGLVFERWATGFRKWHILPAVDEMRNYPVLEDNQEIYLSKKSEKFLSHHLSGGLS